MGDATGDRGKGTRRIAAIDIGGNDIKLIVRDVDATGAITARPVPLEDTATGLRFAVSPDGSIDPDRYRPTVDALRRIAARLDGLDVDETRVTSCSAARLMDAWALAAFSGLIGDVLHTGLHVLDGGTEARLGFLAAAGVAPTGARRIISIDVGSGSTEIAIGDATGPKHTTSVPIGGNSLKLQAAGDERPDHLAELSRLGTAAIGNEYATAPGDVVVMLGGAATTITAYATGIRDTDPMAVEGATIGTGDLAAAAYRLSELDDAQRLGTGCVIKGREAGIHCSAIILAVILGRIGATSATASSRGIADAIIDNANWNAITGRDD